jgi:hypothetical protein
MRLDAAAQAASKMAEANHSILIYGPPKSGKTELAATAAKIPAIKRIFWIDTENGSSTITTMGLPPEALAKFILYKIPDTRDNPRAIETVLKMMTSKTKLKICDEHGHTACPECNKNPSAHFEEFLLSDCNHEDLVVIDSGSQLSTSAINAACLGKGDLYKPQFDDWAIMGKWLTDILLVVKQAQHTNMVVLTHVLSHEGEDKVERLYPLMGTKAFSTNVGKFFGTVVYTHVTLGKHQAASGSTYKPNVITGSRLNVKLEDKKEQRSMYDILVAGGVLKA